MRAQILAGLLVILTVFTLSPKISHAQETPNTTMPIKHVNYDLAFPGILPDHPLYKLKVLRDKVSAKLINDPIKKAEFYLLQADKGILATAMLIDKNNIKLAEETALKAENNVTLATFELKRASKKPSNELFIKLKTASLKHQEVLDTIVKKLSSNDQETFIKVLNFSKTNLQTIDELQAKKYYK